MTKANETKPQARDALYSAAFEAKSPRQRAREAAAAKAKAKAKREA